MDNKIKIKIIILFICLILIDIITKILAIGTNIEIIPNLLRIKYIENTGIAFSMFSKSFIVTISNIFIIIVLTIILIKYRKTSYIYPISIILSGGIGNLIDRIFRGYVVDFINIEILNFPTFNIADIYICIGIILLIVEIIKRNTESETI